MGTAFIWQLVLYQSKPRIRLFPPNSRFDVHPEGALVND